MFNNNNNSEEHPRVSMKTQFNRLIREYTQSIVNGSASSNPQYAQLISTLIKALE